MRLLQLAACREEVVRIEITVPFEVADYLLNTRPQVVRAARGTGPDDRDDPRREPTPRANTSRCAASTATTTRSGSPSRSRCRTAGRAHRADPRAAPASASFPGPAGERGSRLAPFPRFPRPDQPPSRATQSRFLSRNPRRGVSAPSYPGREDRTDPMSEREGGKAMSNRGFYLGVAMLVIGGVARGGEVEATPVCRGYGPTTTYYPDPCCRVGPVRRFLRRVFHPCCPPPVARYAPAPVVVPCPAPCPAPGPAAWVPPAPPANLDRPIAPRGTIPPPPIDVPSSLKRDDLPKPTPPIRFDRIASRRGGEEGQLVTLVQVGNPDSRSRPRPTPRAGSASN